MNALLERRKGEYEAAKKRFHEAIVQAFPVGSEIKFEWGDVTRRVNVLEHSGDRLRVKSEGGVCSYWINFNNSIRSVS